MVHNVGNGFPSTPCRNFEKLIPTTDGSSSNSWFRVKKGVRQGCVISPCLFNILAEMVMRRVLENWNGGFKIGGITINNLRYADDIVLIAETAEELQELVDRLVKEGTNYNLLLNVAKTKVNKHSRTYEH